MAENDRGTGAGSDNLSLGSQASGAGAMIVAWGRTSSDLASDRPPAQSNPDLKPTTDPDSRPLSGMDEVTGHLGGTKVDPDTGGDLSRGRRRNLEPGVDPDTRLGLQPTVAPEALPEVVPDAPLDARTRAATGAVAGLAGSAVVAGLAYLLVAVGAIGTPTFLAAERSLLGSHGLLDHVLAIAGLLVLGGAGGAIYGTLVARPTVVNGVLFGVLPALLSWLLVAPLSGHTLAGRNAAAGVILPFVFNALAWGGIVGRHCRRWLRPPSTTATAPATD